MKAYRHAHHVHSISQCCGRPEQIRLLEDFLIRLVCMQMSAVSSRATTLRQSMLPPCSVAFLETMARTWPSVIFIAMDFDVGG
ncbi:hypothetical protein A0H81_12490 [Grifola frondosa]|uniref:Uncharacterized protein n=1 Tax=Grifola frondosa TaxID=5627 RepID=A0A1C7LY37_GRIFR|nr:hypothetical protein A0H81_12490 [Grifola frondosa]